jgi:hypothetical protein
MSHQGKYPWNIPPNSAVFVSYWQARAELGTTRILVCPSDHERSISLSFSNLNNDGYTSYFLNYMALEHQSISPLSGDRNISGSGNITNENVSWTAGDNHNTEGNIVLADGQVQQVSTKRLQKLVGAALSKNYSIYIKKP